MNNDKISYRGKKNSLPMLNEKSNMFKIATDKEKLSGGWSR